jgi:hypothetical protein
MGSIVGIVGIVATCLVIYDFYNNVRQLFLFCNYHNSEHCPSSYLLLKDMTMDNI